MKASGYFKTLLAAAVAVVLIATAVMVSGCAMFPLEIRRPIVNHTSIAIAGIYMRNTGDNGWGNPIRTPRTYQASDGTTRYSMDYNGNYIYDNVGLEHGGIYPYSFTTPRVPEGQTPQYKTVDVKLVAKNGIVFGRNNIDLAKVERIVITKDDLYPVLIMQNNTGFPISITNPVTSHVDVEDNIGYQVDELKDDRKEVVSYTIGNYRFDKEVVLDKPENTIALTDKPPTITVQNNTGYPITVKSPFNESIANGAYSSKYPKSSNSANPRHVITYNCGAVEYIQEVMLVNEDVVVTLTERPPYVTIQNHTGNTVNLVFLRNPGSNWPDQNMLTIRLKDDGTLDDTEAATQAGERRGSFTNKETFRFWMGNVRGLKVGRYDIRLDDVQGNPYVKSNLQITEDITLTFTQQDKP
jgi:hypothetical protein